MLIYRTAVSCSVGELDGGWDESRRPSPPNPASFESLASLEWGRPWLLPIPLASSPAT